MSELVQYIESQLAINKNDAEKIATLFEEVNLSKGEFFCHAGERCEKLAFVHSGFVRIFKETESKEVTQWVSSQGGFVTDLSSLLFQTPSRWEIQALTDCELYSIGGSDYRALGNKIENWPTLEKQFIASCFVTLENRVFSHLSSSAEERYDQLFEYNQDLFKFVPQQYLASMLGMSPETFSRIRAKKVS